MEQTNKPTAIEQAAEKWLNEVPHFMPKDMKDLLNYEGQAFEAGANWQAAQSVRNKEEISDGLPVGEGGDVKDELLELYSFWRKAGKLLAEITGIGLRPDVESYEKAWNKIKSDYIPTPQPQEASKGMEDEWYCTEPNCVIPNRCYHQGKPTLCGEESRLKKVCEYCEGKGYFINEDHPKWPEVQQKLDCWYCNCTGKTSTPVNAEPTPSISDFKAKVLDVLGKFYEYGDKIGYSNTELSRIRSCIKKVEEIEYTPTPSISPVKSKEEMRDVLKEIDDYLSDEKYEKGKPVHLNSIGAFSVLHRKVKAILNAAQFQTKPQPEPAKEGGVKTRVISAFPGTGKTHFVQNSGLKCLDSDSSQFEKSKFPWNYIEHIEGNIGKYDYIFVSSHQVVRDALVASDIKFMCVYPDMSCKKEYLQRYKDRGNNEPFIKLLQDNWQNWIEDLDCAFQFPTIRLTRGLYISDIFPATPQPANDSRMVSVDSLRRLITIMKDKCFLESVIIEEVERNLDNPDRLHKLFPLTPVNEPTPLDETWKDDFEEWVRKSWPQQNNESAGCRGAARYAMEWVWDNIINKPATQRKIENCLGYALRFWNLHNEYKIYYHPGHAINSPVVIKENHWLPAEDYGYRYFSMAFDGLLTEFEKELLERYFKIQLHGNP